MLWLDSSLSSRLALQKRALLFAVVTVLILFVFQPFGTYESVLSYKFLRLAGYGVATFLAIFVAGFIEISVSHFRDKFAYYPQCIIALYIVIAAFFNHSYFVVAIYNQWRLENQLMFILYVSAIAIIPILIMYLRSGKEVKVASESQEPQVITEKPATEVEATQMTQPVDIVGENKSDILSVALSDIVLLKSADNYCEIVTKKAEVVSTVLLRVSLSKALAQLPNNETIVRCHRSFGVNLSMVKSYQGNANGLQLELYGIDTTVPVSRSYVNEVKVALSLIP